MTPNSPNELLATAQEALRAGESRKAIRFARRFARVVKDPHLRALNLAGILIDGGTHLRKAKLIREGIRELESIAGGVPERLKHVFHYNLGNGYSAIGERQRGRSPGTKPLLDLAVSHLDEALELQDRPDVRANLAGALLAQGRWVEAADEFAEVVNHSPSHHNALARRGSALMGIYNWTDRHMGLLMGALEDHEEAVELASQEPVFQESYRRVIDDLQNRVKKPNRIPSEAPEPDQRWIWENRLALNPCPVCRRMSPDAFDLFPLAGTVRGGDRRPPVEDVLDIVNSLCRSFSTGRWNLYQAMNGVALPTDHVIMADGNAGARHDLRIGLIMAAASQFYSVFSQIGFALNSYFHLGHSERTVSFQSVWCEPGSGRKTPMVRSDIHHSLRRRSEPALAALHRVARALEHGMGRYSDLRDLWNDLEHHLVVPMESDVQSRYFVSRELKGMEWDALRLGRIAKAAIWYLGGSLLYGEKERLKRAMRKGERVGRGIQPIRRR